MRKADVVLREPLAAESRRARCIDQRPHTAAKSRAERARGKCARLESQSDKLSSFVNLIAQKLIGVALRFRGERADGALIGACKGIGGSGYPAILSGEVRQASLKILHWKTARLSGDDSSIKCSGCVGIAIQRVPERHSWRRGSGVPDIADTWVARDARL